MPDQPTFYDPTSPNEQAPPLPSAPLQQLTPQSVLQPPLSRRGTGPGLILLLPPNIDPSTRPEKPLDPEPVEKWAEEGFTVVGITSTSDMVPLITNAVDIIKTHENVNIKDKIGIIAYECPKDLFTSQLPPEIVCMAAFTEPTTVHLPTYFHTSTQDHNKTRNVTVSTYPNVKQHFVLPNSSSYDPPSANIAHTRNLVFLKKHIGGPEFDIEAIWEEHTYWEFERRSVAQTMATMVVSTHWQLNKSIY